MTLLQNWILLASDTSDAVFDSVESVLHNNKISTQRSGSAQPTMSYITIKHRSHSD